MNEKRVEVMSANLNFEQAIKRLEEIVNKLESGIEDLEKTVALYEEGSKLVDFCSEKLHAVENKIETLTKATAKESDEE